MPAPRPDSAPSAGPSAGQPLTVLVVEDEPTQAALLADALRSEGFEPECLADGNLVAERVRRDPPAVVLLDLVLPGRDGLAVCRDIRGFSTVPIIMITGRVDEIDRLLGLESGADDYVCKPFHPREVVARVRALLRRVQMSHDVGAATAGLRLDEDCFEARYNGALLDLTPVEFRLLRALADRPGRVLSRNQLLDAIYDDGRVVSDRTVDSHVKNLRRKLVEAAPGSDPVESVYGVGYKFTG